MTGQDLSGRAPTLAVVEWPWPEPKCILCLREEEKLSRAHLFPEVVGGLLWSRTHCRDCNSFLGHAVEGAIKDDPSFRYAIERGLRETLPELAAAFSERQSYIARGADDALLRATRRDGEHRIVAATSDDGTLTQSRENAREGIERRLRKGGLSDAEIALALQRFDDADEGAMVEVAPDLVIRHGSVEGWDLPFDGERVSDLLPAAIAFHFLGLRIRRAIYSEIFNSLRDEIRSGASEPTEFIVESGLSRLGYKGAHIVGVEQTMPHVVIRVQFFGELMYRVHLKKLCAKDVLPCDGIALDLATKTLTHLPPKPERALVELPS